MSFVTGNSIRYDVVASTRLQLNNCEGPGKLMQTVALTIEAKLKRTSRQCQHFAPLIDALNIGTRHIANVRIYVLINICFWPKWIQIKYTQNKPREVFSQSNYMLINLTVTFYCIYIGNRNYTVSWGKYKKWKRLSVWSELKLHIALEANAYGHTECCKASINCLSAKLHFCI